MSGIAALYNYDGRPADPRVLADMADALKHRGPDATGIWQEGAVGFGHRMLSSTPESRTERQPHVTTDGLIITADARLDNRDELVASLDLPRSASPALSDSELIAAAYDRWQEDCPEKLLGDFAFCVWDRRRRTLFGARDHMGVKPFYYHRSDRQVIVASEIGAIFRVGTVARRLNIDRIADYLLPLLEDQVSTFYQDIVRLPPGHCLSATPDSIRLRRYWSLDPQREVRYRTDEEYAAALREIFFEAVRCRLRSAHPIGSLLSGGLDSSSIVCAAHQLLSREGGPELQTFSAVFDGTPECDERAFGKSVIEGTGVRAHYVAGDASGPLADFQEALAHEDEPYYAPNMFLHRALYKAARANGVRVLLDGIDGDPAISHGMARITELTRRLRLVAAAKEIRAVAKRLDRSAWQIARTRAIAPSVPAPLRKTWRTLARLRGQGAPGLVLSEQLARRAAARTKAFERPAPMTARQDHLLGLSSGVIPFALEVADRAAARLHIEPRYPFFDKRLLEYCVALPADQKLRNGWTRWVMRGAMQGTLPERIRWRGGKSNLGPNFTATFLREDIADPSRFLSVAPYVDASSVRRIHRRAFAERRDSDAVALWRVATLDAWLDHASFDSAKR